jgi:hypothetical protein
VQRLTEGEGGPVYTQEGFRANRVDDAGARDMVEATGDPRAAMGGNACQSEPCFEYLIKSYG